MKLLLFVALVVVGANAAGEYSSCCTAEDAATVQDMWDDIWSAEFTGRRIAVAAAVFADLFDNNPGVVDLFERVKAFNLDCPEFRAHCVRVVNGLDTAINMLGYPEALNAELMHLSKQHAARDGVQRAHFDAIAVSFGKVLPQVSNSFNSDAWNHCFGAITRGIRHGLA